MLSRCCNLTTLPLPFPLSFASLDTHGNGIAESSWLTDYYNNSCRYMLCDDLDARAMFACLGVLLLLLLRSGDRFQVSSLFGNVVISKKILRTRKIMVMHSNERGEYVYVPS